MSGDEFLYSEQPALEQLLFFREGIEGKIVDRRDELRLNELEFPFYNILMAEITKASGESNMDEAAHKRVLSLVKKLVDQFEKGTKIVGFFLKKNEIKLMERNIKHSMVEEGFEDRELIKVVKERFMELAKVKFK